MPSPLTETHVIEGEPDAFHDAALVAEVVRIYNYKRAFCGQTRIDLGTPTTKVFKEGTDYADGPVTGDVDTEVSCRDTGSFRDYLLLLWLAIPQTYAARKTVGLDKYFWCTPGTDDPLPLPDGWEGLVVTAETLKSPALWGTVFPLIIEAVNALQEMYITVKPIAQMRDFSYTGRYVTYSLEEGPEMFQVVNNGPATRGTRRRPIYSTAAIVDEPVGANPVLLGVYFGTYIMFNIRPARWSFSIPGFESSEYFCINAGPDTGGSRDEFGIADHGVTTKTFLGVTRCDFTARVTVQTSGTYTIGYGIVNEWPNYKGKTASATFDGTTTSFSLLTTGVKTATTTRYITAPYQDFDCSVSVDFGISDFWETDVRSSDGGARTPVFAFDSEGVWQSAGDGKTNSYVGAYPAMTTQAGFPFSVGFGFEVGATIDGEWDGWSYDTSGNRFWVDTSRYAISYQRTIYNVGGVKCRPTIGVS